MPTKTASEAKLAPKSPTPAAKKSSTKTPAKKMTKSTKVEKVESTEEAVKPLPKKEHKEFHKETTTPKDYKLPQGRYYYSNGKRKTSVALVRLYKGDGSVFVNEKALENYFKTKLQKEIVKFPLKLTGYEGKFTITVNVMGGGLNSQAEAVRHGVAKALVLFDEGLKHTIKQAGLLTRDPRSKERKKFGLHRARRAPQFSKR